MFDASYQLLLYLARMAMIVNAMDNACDIHKKNDKNICAKFLKTIVVGCDFHFYFVTLHAISLFPMKNGIHPASIYLGK